MRARKLSGLTYRCFRERRMPFAICLSICVLFGITFFSENYAANSILQRKMTYGYHNGAVFDIGGAEEKRIRNHRAVTACGRMDIYGEILDPANGAAGSIGAVDESFQKMEQLAFLEGTYPARDNEIAVEEAVLDELRCPYDIGSTITLNIRYHLDGIEKKVKKQYRLCGILENYSAHWKNEGYPLCGAIVSEMDGLSRQRHIFFCSEYREEQQMEELKWLLTDRTRHENQIVYNSYSFPSEIDSLSDAAEHGFVIGIAILLCLLFILAVQLREWKRQRYGLKVFRLLGAGNRTLGCILMKNAVLQWLIWCAASISVCSGFALARFLFLSHQKRKIPYIISAKPYVYAVAFSLPVVVVGKWLFLLMMKRAEPVPSGKGVGKYEDGGRVGRKKRIKFSPDGFRRIEKQRMRKQFGLELAYCVAAVSILAVCVQEICGSCHDYAVNSIVNSYDYQWTAYGMSGMDMWQIQQIKNTEYMECVDYASCFYSDMYERFSIRYEGMEADPYAELFQPGDAPETEGMDISIVMLPEGSGLWEYYFPENCMEKDAFLRGEQVILYLPDMMKSKGRSTAVNILAVNSGYHGKNVLRSSVRQGTEIQICTTGHGTARTRCGYVMKKYPGEIQSGRDILLPGTVLISENLYRKLFKTDEIKYNQVMAWGGPQLSYDVSDKKMSFVANTPDITFVNTRLEREKYRKNFRMNAGLLGGTGVFLCILCLFLIYRNRLEFLEAEQPRIRIFQLLGMKKAMLSRLYERHFMGWLILYSVLCNAALCLIRLEHEYAGVITAGTLANRWKTILRLGMYRFPWVLCVAVQALALFGMYGVGISKFTRRRTVELVEQPRHLAG